MENAIYSAIFGSLSNEYRLNLIANNLANVNTAGYKQDKVAFQDVMQPYAHDRMVESKEYIRGDAMWPRADLLSKVRLSQQATDFTQGQLRRTGNPLDLAISGEGFFKVQGPGGETFYTRNGNFMLDADGVIVDASGNALQGTGGPIQVPPGTKDLQIDTSGAVRADGQDVDQLDVVRFEDPQALLKLGHNLYTTPAEGGVAELPGDTGQAAAPDGEEYPRVVGQVQQGFLESSNVEVVSEMVRMIEVQRTFESYQKMMQSTQQMDQKLISTAQKL